MEIIFREDQENFMNKVIDMAYSIKIMSGDEKTAQQMMKFFITTFPETRAELANSYCDSDPAKFCFAVDKLYDGTLHVGAPALREAAYELLIALKEKKEPQIIDQLYQRMLGEMVAFEQAIAELNF
jgi:HPt (histidine-containing phosphotransfer) domain-containing protein